MQSIRFKEAIRVRANACTGGAMEKEGPIGAYLDESDETGKFEGETWEESESRMLKKTIECAIKKAGKETKDIDYLSMGMSGDYPLAIEGGSTMVRVGTALFGARTGYPQINS